MSELTKQIRELFNPNTRNRSTTNTLENNDSYIYLDKYIKLLQKEKKISYEDIMKMYEDKHKQLFFNIKINNPDLQQYEIDFFDYYFFIHLETSAIKYIVDNVSGNHKNFYVPLIKYMIDNKKIGKITIDIIKEFNKPKEEEIKSNEYIISFLKKVRKSRKSKKSRKFKKSKKLY